MEEEGDLGELEKISLEDTSVPIEVEGQQEKKLGLRSISIIEHQSLYEKNLEEYFNIFQIYKRIHAIKSWLLKRKEKRIVIVGHSIFFQLFLQSEKKMENCEISQVILHENGSCTDFEILFTGGLSLIENNDDMS